MFYISKEFSSTGPKSFKFGLMSRAQNYSKLLESDQQYLQEFAFCTSSYRGGFYVYQEYPDRLDKPGLWTLGISRRAPWAKLTSPRDVERRVNRNQSI